MKKERIVEIILLAIALAGLGWFVYSAENHSCSMGVTGTTANVTFSGVQSQGFCSNPGGWTFDNTHFYALSQAPQGTVLCEGQLSSNGETAHYVVRDSGILNTVGSGLCTWLGEGAPNTNP